MTFPGLVAETTRLQPLNIIPIGCRDIEVKEGKKIEIIKTTTRNEPLYSSPQYGHQKYVDA
jgi:hypothetical protein